MIPILLIGAGAYLLYDSQKPQKIADGGEMAKGGAIKDEYYIDYLNKKKNFQKDRKYFESYEKARQWALRNFEKFSPDMIKQLADGGLTGGAIKWQDVEVGDSALVKSENKMGVIVKTYGRKFHLKFVDGTDKTYDADELKFIKEYRDDLYENGGIIQNPVFTFKTDNDYHNARSSGYIDDYDIVRIEVKHPSGGGVDFATHSEEEYFEALKRIRESGAEIVRTYQDKMYYDINDYYDPDEDRGVDEDEYATGGEIDTARNYVMFVDSLQEADRLGMGGKVKFKDKVKSISENLKGRKVPKFLQKEYGKTYDKKWERDESARRIAGSQLKRMNIK